MELFKSCTFWALLLLYAFAVALLICGMGKLDTPLKQIAFVVAFAPTLWLPAFLAARWLNKIDPSLTRPEEENLSRDLEPLWQRFIRFLNRSDAKLCPRKGSTVALGAPIHPPVVDPKIAEFVYVILMTGVGAQLIVWSVQTIARAVQTGVMPGRGVLYPRPEKPCMYWVLMFFHGFLILLGFACIVAALGKRSNL